VLLIEDHCDTRNVLELLLKRCGCQTVAAKNAKKRERVSATWISTFSSVISTCLTAMIDLVREAKGRHNLKAIAVTGRTSAEERERGLRAGFDVYLTKRSIFTNYAVRSECRGTW